MMLSRMLDASDRAARVLDAALAVISDDEEDTVSPTRDDIVFALQAIARDAARKFFLQAGIDHPSDFEVASLINVFVGVTQGAVLDIDPDDARLMPGEKTFKTMMEVRTVKGIPKKEQERMLKRAAAADRRDT